jgi:hypothetical protein
MDTVEKMHYIGKMRKQDIPVRIKLRDPDKYGTKTAIIYNVQTVDYYIIFKKGKDLLTKKVLIGEFDIAKKVSKKDIQYWNKVIYDQRVKEIDIEMNQLWGRMQKLHRIKEGFKPF